jgi:hypothetical protein
MFISIDVPEVKETQFNPNDFVMFKNSLCRIMTLYPSHYLADLYKFYDGAIISRASYADIQKVPEGTIITITV